MRVRTHALRAAYVVLLVVAYVVVGRVGLPHLVRSGIVGGLLASAAAWVAADLTQRRRSPRGRCRRRG